MFGLRLTLFLVGCFLRLCAAQAAGWQEGQVNTTMCQWQSPRAAVVRDTLFLDGGYLWWKPGMSDGSYDPFISDGNPLGLVYMLNFSSPFNISQNSSDIFTTFSKAAGGGASNNIGPQYYDGAMFANDFEWYTYGGQLRMTDAFKAPAANAVAAYQVYPSGEGKAFNRGFILDTLPDGVSRYITNGAAVSVPSENLGFYFAGLRSASFGPISYLPPPKNESLSPDRLSTTLIQLDMTTQGKETWKNKTLPTTVPGRASPEIVWIPVSEKGILVALGGVIFPSYLIVNQTNNASSTAQSEEQSPLFMSTVSVYDIAKDVWYEQKTSGAPGQLMQGCTIVASAQDGSSHNIYYYGGFDGLHPTDAFVFSDTVYVLSVPSFKWTTMNSGTTSHARAGHKCTKPYPDQMLVVGGFRARSGTDIKCVENFVQIYNLSSNEWLPFYDPNVFSEYTVPSTLISAIGGTAVGGATVTTPSGGFSSPELQAVLAAPYSKSKIKNWYPYKKAAPTSTDRPTLPLTPVPKSSGTPAYLGPVIGVVLGLFFLTLVVLAYMLWKKRKLLRSSTGTQSEAGTMDHGNMVSRWLHSTPADAKAPTETTEETIYIAHDKEPLQVGEIDSAQVYEIGDTSKVELPDTNTGLVPIGQSNREFRNSSLAASPSSQTYQTNNTSNSRWSQSEAPARPNISPLPSPTGGSSPTQSQDKEQRIASEISNFSETDRKHLRGISDTSVSTDGGLYPTPNYSQQQQQQQHERPAGISPITPPVALESRDYISAGPAAAISPTSPGDSQSTKRRSNFSEGLEEGEKR